MNFDNINLKCTDIGHLYDTKTYDTLHCKTYDTSNFDTLQFKTFSFLNSDNVPIEKKEIGPMSILCDLNLKKNLNVNGTIESVTISNLQAQIDNLTKELTEIKALIQNKKPRKTYINV